MEKKVDKKTIQRNRVTKYFLDASIEIIKDEGLANLTTKKIGDRAGYSYATIYNYFENFNELICLSMVQIADECAEYIVDNLQGENILDICCNFSDLMVQYNAVNSNIYYPFLSTTVDFSYFDNDENTHFIHPAYQILLDKIESSAEFKDIQHDEIITLMDILTAIFHSALHFFIILKNPKRIDQLKLDIKRQVTYVLKKYI
jgi:AcrR family transcriptional regulator